MTMAMAKRRGRRGAVVMRACVACAIAARFARARGDCVTIVPAPASFEVFAGARFDLTALDATAEAHFGFEEYARFNDNVSAWEVVAEGVQCPPPSPPSPPPPAPPPPARASVAAELTMGGYSAASFGEKERDDFVRAVAYYLGVDANAVTITGYDDGTSENRRRRLSEESGGLRVRFVVDVSDTDVANEVATAFTDTSTPSATTLQESLYIMGLRQITAISVSVPVLAAPPPSPPSPPPPPPSPPSPPPPPPPSPPPPPAPRCTASEYLVNNACVACPAIQSHAHRMRRFPTSSRLPAQSDSRCASFVVEDPHWRPASARSDESALASAKSRHQAAMTAYAAALDQNPALRRA